MLAIIQFVVYFFILPVIYFIILLFDFNLIRRAESQTQRLRMLFGVVAAVLMAVIVILLDQTTDLFKIAGPFPDATKFVEVLPYVAIAFLLGLLLMLAIHALLKTQQVLSFVIMLTILALIVSAYFLMTLSFIRGIVAVSALGFLVGIIIYLMLVPSIVSLLIVGVPLQQSEKPVKPDWS